MISILHPSRGRPMKSFETMREWVEYSSLAMEIIVSLDHDDIHVKEYEKLYHQEPFFRIPTTMLFNDNRSAVDAINNAAKVSTGHILIVVSDDTDCYKWWDQDLYRVLDGKYDFILKTQDGIQPWIITMPVMDRAYYNRFGYIYHPDYLHCFCDTELTCVADITGRKIKSNLMFPHKHYSVTKEQPDEINKKADSTWAQGEKLFIERYKRNFDLPKGGKIEGQGMIDWLIRKGQTV